VHNAHLACLTSKQRQQGPNKNVKTGSTQLDFEDILWLRRAATKAGAVQVPPAIAEKLMNAGLIELGTKPTTLKITEKGRIALNKLG
jgi:hypothetical protein